LDLKKVVVRRPNTPTDEYAEETIEKSLKRTGLKKWCRSAVHALGLTVRSAGQLSTAEGQDVRYVELATVSGDFIEVFDQNLPERDLFRAPVVGFLVDDVPSARREMEEKGVTFIGPVYRGTDWEWSYFRSPEGHVFQIMASCHIDSYGTR